MIQYKIIAFDRDMALLRIWSEKAHYSNKRVPIVDIEVVESKALETGSTIEEHEICDLNWYRLKFTLYIIPNHKTYKHDYLLIKKGAHNG